MIGFQSAPPGDIPVLVDPTAGEWLPATSQPSTLDQWDPWVYADIPQMVDHSVPLDDEYGGATKGQVANFNADWGKMSSPVRDWQDQDYAALFVPSRLPNSSGPVGQFNGPAQTAWEFSYVPPQPSYASTIYLGVGH